MVRSGLSIRPKYEAYFIRQPIEGVTFDPCKFKNLKIYYVYSLYTNFQQKISSDKSWGTSQTLSPSLIVSARSERYNGFLTECNRRRASIYLFDFQRVLLIKTQFSIRDVLLKEILENSAKTTILSKKLGIWTVTKFRKTLAKSKIS